MVREGRARCARCLDIVVVPSGDDEVMTTSYGVMGQLAGYDVGNTSHPSGALMAHERPVSLPLGRLVVEQGHRLSLSQTDVVRRHRNAAKADGRQSGATKQSVSEIERTGRIPHPDGLRWRAEDTGRRCPRPRSETNSGQTGRSHRGASLWLFVDAGEMDQRAASGSRQRHPSSGGTPSE